MANTKVVTGKVRFSYCNIFEPREPQGGGDPKYSVTLLIPKSDTATLNKIKLAIADAREAFCMRDSGEEFGSECKGCYVITVSSRQKPIVVDNMRNAITDPGEVYSGCYGRASINFFGYSSNGKKGISAGLLSIQKLHDGEALGGSRGSADDFDDGYRDAEADDDFLN